jgi:hypothetical protein
MANVYLLNLSQNRVTFGNVFDSSKTYIVKDTLQPEIGNFAFTKVLNSPTLRIYQETEQGILYNTFTDISKRQALGSSAPKSGPYIENYSVNGEIKTSDFINILLIDKPPVRTGFFKFTINGFSFPGIIKQLTTYPHYDWEKTTGAYSYVLKSDSIGYGIEISKNVLYTATDNLDGTYTYTPTPLNLYLRSLTGNEIITSVATTDDPNTYFQSIPGANTKISGSFPESIFYISPEFALRYIASYIDLITTFGADYVKGQEHYAKYGASQGRIISFNPIAYLNKYSDLRTIYGYDTYNATIHYITTGYFEGRSLDESSNYNPLTGGLYDGRFTSSLTSNTIIWPVGSTIKTKGKSLTYKYNSIDYYINSSIDFTSNIIYLKVQ